MCIYMVRIWERRARECPFSVTIDFFVCSDAKWILCNMIGTYAVSVSLR